LHLVLVIIAFKDSAVEDYKDDRNIILPQTVIIAAPKYFGFNTFCLYFRNIMMQIIYIKRNKKQSQ